MPSSATITSFYNFSANTKARASQVNNNFDVFRGHIIPVEPLTATSSDNTYDLGDFSHRWRYGYFGQTRFGVTSTAYGSVQLASDTTAAELIFNLNGIEKFRITTNGYVGNFGRSFGVTTSAGLNQMAKSSLLNLVVYETTTFTSLPGTTLTIQSNGRPIDLKLSQLTPNTTTQFAFGNVGGANLCHFKLVRQNDSVTQQVRIHSDNFIDLPPETLSFTDTPSAGTWTYYLQYKVQLAVFATNYISIDGVNFTAIEK